jgi:hypothetical protein
MFRCLFSAFVSVPSLYFLFLVLQFVASLSRLSVRVRYVPYLLARKCHKCHRNEKEAHFVGNRRASARLSREFNFLRVAKISNECVFTLYLSRFP